MTKDLTKGSVTKTLLMFALPMLIGNIFQQVYNIADTIIVGQKLGKDAIAAVGVSFPIVFLLIAVSMGIGTGASVVISQLFGAKKMQDIKKASYTAIICSVIAGLIFTVGGALITRPILGALNTPENIMVMSEEYLRIIFFGSIFVFVYNICTSIFNALGNSNTPLIFLIISAILNIVLDIYFITQLNLGVGGAALATVIAQSVAAIFAFIYLLIRLRKLTAKKVDKLFDTKLLKDIAKIGLPATIQQSFVSMGMMLLQGVVNSFGSDVVSGFTAACKIDSIAMMPILNLSNAVATFTAQNIGANKIDRVKQGLKSSILSALIFSIVIAVLIFNFGNVFIEMFLDGDGNKEVIDFGVTYLRGISIFYLMMAFMFNFGAVLRGAGAMKVFMLSTLSNMIIRIGFAYMFKDSLGVDVIWMCIPVGWFVGTVVGAFGYFRGDWLNTNIISKEERKIIEEIVEAENETNTINISEEDYV